MRKIAALLACILLALTFTSCEKEEERDILGEIVELANEQIESIENWDIKASARDGALVYTYTCKTDIPKESIQSMKDMNEAFIENDKEIFEDKLRLLIEHKLKSPAVIVETKTKDGELLYIREFRTVAP